MWGPAAAHRYCLIVVKCTDSGVVSPFELRSPPRSTRPALPSESLRLSWSTAPALRAEAGARGPPILVATTGEQSCREGLWSLVSASAQGTGAERGARCLRGNVRVCSAPFALAEIFNMGHDRQRSCPKEREQRRWTGAEQEPPVSGGGGMCGGRLSGTGRDDNPGVAAESAEFCHCESGLRRMSDARRV